MRVLIPLNVLCRILINSRGIEEGKLHEIRTQMVIKRSIDGQN